MAKLESSSFGLSESPPHFICRWMFWSDWGESPRIERAGMDGSHRSSIITQNVRWPNGITLDLVLDRIYWIDAKLNLIGSADLDGANSR